jgi:hypothetical protein
MFNFTKMNLTKLQPTEMLIFVLNKNYYDK